MSRRSVRGVAPTDAGKAVYRHAQTLLKLAAETAHVARCAGSGTSGRVRIGLPSSIAMVLRLRFYPMCERHPGILVELYESPSTYLAPQLSEERVDLSVLVGGAPATNLIVEPLVTESIYFVHERKSNPLAACETVRASQVAGIPLILTTRATTLRHLVDAAFLAQQSPPRLWQKQALSDPAHRCGAGRHRHADTLLRALMASDDALAEAPCDDPAGRRVASLAWSRTAAMTESTQCVRNAIINVTRELVHNNQWRYYATTPPCDVALAELVESLDQFLGTQRSAEGVLPLELAPSARSQPVDLPLHRSDHARLALENRRFVSVDGVGEPFARDKLGKVAYAKHFLSSHALGSHEQLFRGARSDPADETPQAARVEMQAKARCRHADADTAHADAEITAQRKVSPASIDAAVQCAQRGHGQRFYPVGGEFMVKRRSGSGTDHDNAAAKRSDQARQERGRARPRVALAWSRRARDERDQRCNSL